MVISLNRNTDKRINLNSIKSSAVKLNPACSSCGGFHPTDEHWKFMADMPQDPVDMIGDLAKMGIYKPAAFKIADGVNAADLRKTLLLKMAGKGNLKRERLVLELCKQAGGIDNAFAAAFGNKAGEFFGDVVRAGEFSRRRFLKNLAIGAALVTLTNCASSEEPAADDSAAPAGAENLEKKDLKIGFIPITCATPIIMSEPL